MTKATDIILTASAPVIWGSTYIVTTEMLPPDYPLTVAALRALPAGLLLLVATRQVLPRHWYGKLMLLGGLNFTVFWSALFIAAYRLPGGVAATLGAVQPLIVLGLARVVLGTRPSRHARVAAITGIGGVALLVLGPHAKLDVLGIVAALTGAASMALGVILTHKWRPDVPALTFTAWQLTAGGLLLLPLALWVEPALPALNLTSMTGLLWLGVPGAALSYFFWFRGIDRLGPTTVTNFGFLSPLTAVLLGWVVLDQRLTRLQILGALIVLACVWLGSRPSLGQRDLKTPQSKPGNPVR